VVNLFDTPAKAEGYAKARPPLHAAIVERIASRAGLSTAPLLRISSNVYGVVPCGRRSGSKPARHFGSLRV